MKKHKQRIKKISIIMLFFSLGLGLMFSVNAFNQRDLIVYESAVEKRYISVYTDIDCGYCRRFHQEIPSLNESGVTVRYIPFPRAGLNSNSYDKFVSVYCSRDKQQALSLAKSGVSLPKKNCSNAVKRLYQQGVKKGIRLTPTIVTDDGDVILGYKTAQQLVDILN